MPPLRPYQTELSYSYAPGIFPSMALLQTAPERAMRLLLSAQAHGEGIEKLRSLCAMHRIREETADRALAKISGKQNCFAAVVFAKWQAELHPSLPHVLLHHPMDEGNLGTIQRTLLGFGIHDIAIIRPAADVFDPHVVRASMGAIFSLRVKQYDSFEGYRSEFPSHALYPFMLDGSLPLEKAACTHQNPYTLIFGNEGSGLPQAFSKIGQAVRIPHSDAIDSLNLAVAVGLGAYAFIHAENKEDSQ